MTDDSFEWRENRYHAGLDIGERGGAEYGSGTGTLGDVKGASVYAVADGTLRLFGHHSRQVIVYCHDEDVPVHERFHVTERGAGSAWWTGERLRTTTEGPRPGDVFCDDVATNAGGRVALISHSLHGGGNVVTKYAHLDSVTPAIVRALAVNSDCPGSENWLDVCAIDNTTAIQVRRGEQIGSVGNSYYGADNAFADDHVHFEIRTFDGPAVYEDAWYETAFGCSDDSMTGVDCSWTEGRRRLLVTVEDSESYLPPMPASFEPTDPGWGTARPIATANSGRPVFEVASIVLTGGTVEVAVSVAYWRPLFYTGFDGQQSRAQPKGIAGTGPGVTGYGTDIAAAPNHSDAACGGGRFRAAPVATDAMTEGELPRETRQVNLSAANGVCILYVLTTNEAYPAPEVSIIPNPLDPYRKHISIPDPIATLIYSGTLMSGSRDVSGSLSGVQFRVYVVEVYAASTYEFCTTQVSDACVDEAAGAGTVLELWQGTNRLGLSAASNLSWTADSDGTVFLVVRGDYASGAAAPNAGPYTLSYTAPPPPDCSSLDSFARGASEAAEVCVPLVPGNLRVRDVTDESATLPLGSGGRCDRLPGAPGRCEGR